MHPSLTLAPSQMHIRTVISAYGIQSTRKISNLYTTLCIALCTHTRARERYSHSTHAAIHFHSRKFSSFPFSTFAFNLRFFSFTFSLKTFGEMKRRSQWLVTCTVHQRTATIPTWKLHSNNSLLFFVFSSKVFYYYFRSDLRFNL